MKLALALVLATATAAAAPTASAPVDDAAHVLTGDQSTRLAGELRALHDFDMAVVVVRTTGGVPIETYAHGTALAWHTGSRPSALLVLALDDRASRLELDATMRAHVSDRRAQTILDDVRPQLRAKDYTGAIGAVVANVREAFTRPVVADPAPTPAPPSTPVLPYVLLGCGAVLAGGCLWAGIARRRTATISSGGAQMRPFVLDALWCTLKLLGVLVVVCYVLLSIFGSGGSSSSRSTWGATQRRRSSSDSSSSGGATSSW